MLLMSTFYGSSRQNLTQFPGDFFPHGYPKTYDRPNEPDILRLSHRYANQSFMEALPVVAGVLGNAPHAGRTSTPARSRLFGRPLVVWKNDAASSVLAIF